jgi:amino acid adenylation domain-containing protein/non-ribosomal peptide synthase protein (TIGR01720 family)
MKSVADRLAHLSPAKRALLQRVQKSNGSSASSFDVITRYEGAKDALPLSSSQQRLWFLDQLERPNATYNMSVSVRLNGPLDCKALENALKEIVRRHEALRTNFISINGEPIQVVCEDPKWEMGEIDITDTPALECQARMSRLAASEAQYPFDLTKDSLMRATVIKMAEEEHILLITMHHIVSDGWSIGNVFLNELITLYTDFSQGRKSSLDALPLQYSDFSIWQREWLKGDRLAPHLAYWTQQLAGVPALLELPTDYPRPAAQTFFGQVYNFKIDAELLGRLKLLSQKAGATLFMTLLSGFNAILSRYSGQSDVVVGSPIANRSRKELEPLIGFFVNSLVLRTTFTQGMTGAELLAQTRQTCLDAFKYQDVPFERVVDAVKPERNPSFSPLFQVMFILQTQNVERGDLKAGELKLTTLPIDSGTSMFDLTLKLEEQGGEIHGEFEYNTALFKLDTIERFIGHYICLLDSLARDPNQRLLQLPLMLPAEREQLLSQVNQTEKPYDFSQNVPSLFSRQVIESPERVAIRFEDQQLTYAELDQRTSQLARHLISLGAGPDKLIGLSVERDISMLVGLLGILKSGSAYVPLDPTYPKDRLTAMIESSGLELLITQESCIESLPDQPSQRILLDRDWPLIEQATGELTTTLLPDSLAYVIYTSGSTGKPKGVQISHRALTNFLFTMQEKPGLTRQDILLAVTTISFDIAGLELYLPLITGAEIVLASREISMDGFALLGAIRQAKATVMQATPATWRMLMLTGAKDLGLQRVFCGGEALDGELAAQLLSTGAEIWNLYGPTETTIWSTACPVLTNNIDLTSSIKSAASIGMAIGNTQVYVLDEYLEPTPIGIPGELYIGGTGVSRGYFNQPGLTAERFVPDPFGLTPGARLYRTGDLTYFNSNRQLMYSGRIDFQVKVRGFRIELGEIEATLNSHEAVQNAVAVVRMDQAEQAQIVAYVQTDTDWTGPEDAINQDNEQIEKWKVVWEETYKDSNDRLGAEPSDDLSGWLSTYTGKQIDTAEMSRWTQETVERILALKPSQVLEIGCGTGLLLTRLSKHVSHYRGVDFSASVLSKLTQRLTQSDISIVSLVNREATDFSNETPEIYDTVIINSVAQYFQNIEYLIEVIEKSIGVIKDGGHLYLGDLRALCMQTLQYLSVAHFQHTDETSANKLKQLVQAATRREEELIIDLQLFAWLKDRINRISGVECMIKRTSDHNEMSKFRVDVVIHVGQREKNQTTNFTEILHYHDHAFDQAGLEEILNRQCASVLIRDFPNVRLREDATLFDRVFSDAQTESEKSLQTTESKPTAADLTIEQLISIGQRLGYQTFVAWSGAHSFLEMDIIYRQGTANDAFGVPIEVTFPDFKSAGKTSKQFANHPDRNVHTRMLSALLRTLLEEKLPAYMIPSSIVCMDQMPMTPNGKIDRRALPAPDTIQKQESYVAPRTDSEALLCEIWSKLLNYPNIGVFDNFFTLGGHSLLAVQVISKVRDAFSIELPIQALFDSPTVAQLADSIEKRTDQPKTQITPIGVRADKTSEYSSLSFAQQRLWFLSQLEGLASTYLISGAVRIKGNLNTSLLENVFSEIVRRHESLRTRFIEIDGQARAHIQAAAPFNIRLTSVETLNAADQAVETAKLIAEETNRPFELSTDLLFRVTIIRHAEDLHTMVMSLHHIISDEWSMALLQQEIVELYRAFSSQQASPLRPLAIQYADYASWQREQLTRDRLGQQLDYWVTHLSGAPALLELPTDFPRPSVARNIGQTHSFMVDREIMRSVKRLSQTTGSTLFMTLLAAWSALLSRHAGTSDLVIGSPMTNRNRSELEKLIGFFVNTVALRLNLAGEPSTRKLLERVRRIALDAYANQDVPFDYIVEQIKPERSLSYTPIFQAMFVMQNAPTAELAFNDLSLELIQTETLVSKFDLTLSVEENEGALAGVIEYNTDLFTQATIEKLGNQFAHLLKEMASQPDLPVASLPLISLPAWKKIHEKSLQSDLNWSDNRLPESVVTLFEKVALVAPDSTALTCNGQSMSYASLQTQSNKLAASLRRQGVVTNSVIGLYAEPGFNMVIGMLGILKAGAAYLPLLPGTPVDRLNMMLAETDVRCVLNASADLHLPLLNTAQIQIDALLAQQTESEICNWKIEPSGIAYIIYTSGSTGQPKGVMVSHQNLACSTQARLEYYKFEFNGLLLLQPFSFDVATGNIFWTLCAGAALHLESRSLAQDTHQLLLRLKETQSSHLVLLPLLYGPLLDLAEPEALASLRNVIVGGEKMPHDLVQKHINTLPHVPLFNEYGPTEATVMCCAYQAQANDPGQPVPIGKPISPSTIYLLDPYLNPVPQGMAGELCIGGPQVAHGYLAHPALTAEKFVPDIFSHVPGARIYRSGDIARQLADSNIEYLGRSDQQVKIRGFRVELGEIQAQVKSFKGVKDCVVMALELGASKRLVAYLVLAENTSFQEQALRKYLEADLPEYMLPSFFVELAEFPLTSNGKLDYRTLPNPEESNKGDGHIAPSTATEQKIADIWSEVLGLKHVGIEDNFFTLGGDSILSIQIVSRANRAGIHVTVKQLFQHQTIRKLAACVTVGHAIVADQQPCLGPFELSPIQKCYLNGDPANPDHFNQSLLLRIEESLSDAHIKTAINALVQHHDMLRARFIKSPTGWDASISEDLDDHALVNFDISTLSLAQQTEFIHQTATEAQQSLSISHGPIWRIVRYRTEAGAKDKLLWIIHHLCVDGVSWRILLEDLEASLAQLSRHMPLNLPFKTSSFPLWSEKLRGYAADPANQASLDYWLEQTDKTYFPLPTDYALIDASQNDLGSLRKITTILPTDISQALLTSALKFYRAQINDLLLTALADTIEQWTGHGALSLTLEGHGREDLFEDMDISRTVGWFTSGFPVLLDLTSAPNMHDRSISRRLNNVKNTLREIPDHGVGFGIFRRMHPDLSIRQALAKGDTPQLSFNYLGQFIEPAANQFILSEASEATGPEQAATGKRVAQIEINGIFRAGALEFTWAYSELLHQAQTIENLAQSFVDALTHICRYSQSSEAADQSYAAQDFALAQLDQSSLDFITSGTPQFIEDIYPLSPMQQGMLFHSQMQEDAGNYIIQLSSEMHGNFEVDIFVSAWQMVLERHPSLRAKIITLPGCDPLQVIVNDITLPWVFYDWRGQSNEKQIEQWTKTVAHDRSQGFDPQTAPMMRCTLAQTSDQSWRFLWSHHHLLTDGWCLPILLGEVLTIYQAAASGQVPELTTPRPYRDYIEWLSTRDIEDAKAYWRQNLKGFDTPTAIVTQPNLNLHAVSTYQTHAIEIEADVSERLIALSKQYGLTLSILIQGAWSLLLSRYSGSNDIVFGATVSGRPPEIADVDGMVGLFINTLPVRVVIDPSQSVIEFLCAIRDEQLTRDEYAYTPLVDIHGCSDVPARQPLFDSIVIFENYPVDQMLDKQAQSLQIDGIEVLEQTSFPFTLTAAPGTRIPIKLTSDTTRLDSKQAQGLLEHFTNLLRAVHQNIDDNVGAWQQMMLDPMEQAQLIQGINQTQHQTPEHALSLAALFERQAEAHPERIAVVFEEKTLTYAELNCQANQIASLLLSLHIGSGKSVAIFLNRSETMLAALLGVQKSGAAYVPFDPAYPTDRIAYMLENSGVDLIVCDHDTALALPSQTARHVVLSQVLQDTTLLKSNPLKTVEPDSLAYMIYTSGSTGKPKGVELTHRGLTSFLLSMARAPGLTNADTLLAVTTISFDIAALELYLPILVGGKVVIASRETAMDATRLAHEIHVRHVTVLQATPTTWRMLSEAGWDDHSSLLKGFCGGEGFPHDLAQQMLANGLDVWNLYGPTETTIWSSAYQVVAQKHAQPYEDIGLPIDNTTMYLVDDSLNICPDGIAGELLIGGVGLALGYKGLPAMTAEKFIPDPFGPTPGARLYRTGDRARAQPNGMLACLGRLDHQIKVRGFRIEPGEIEVIIQQHPDVVQAIVLVWEPNPGDHRLAAYVTTVESRGQIDSIRESVRLQLPAHMVPTEWILVEHFPLTPNGKLDRKALPDPSGRQQSDWVQPLGETENILSTLMAEVLNMDQVGRNNDFFDLGGHSLLAGRLVTKITQTLQLRIPLAVLFDRPTVKLLGQYIETQRWAAQQQSDAPEILSDDEEEFKL